MTFKFSKLLGTQSGFTLPEVMIGGAIIAGVAMAGAMLFRDQTKAQSRVEHDQLLASFHSQLSKTLENTHNCNATMKMVGGAPGKYNATTIGTSDSSALTGFYICNTAGTTCNLGSDAQNVDPIAYIAEGEWIDKGTGSRQIWRIKNIDFANTLTSTGAIRLRVNYELNPRIGVREVAKETVLNLRFTNPTAGAKTFKECFNDQESAVNNLQNDVCKTLNPVSSTGVASTGALTYWDEALQTCVLAGTGSHSSGTPLKDCTAQGLGVEGIRPDGTVHCKSLSEGFDAAGNTQPSGTNCPAGTKARLSWNGTIMQVTCAP